MTERHQHGRSGLVLGLCAYLLWGIAPIYFKQVSHLQSTEVVAHRIVWSIILLGALMTLSKRWSQLAGAVRQPRLLAALVASSLLIAINWLVYMWAVLNGHVLAASLGYYLNPLVNVLLGVVLLKERLRPLQTVAVAIAAAGVAGLAAGAMGTLGLSLTLAASFALYGFVRKVIPVEALEGLTAETFLLAPVALAWLLYLAGNGQSSFGESGKTNFLLIASSVVTAAPLLMFTAAAKRLPYSTLGFLQYVAPTLQFMLAVALFKERLTLAHVICFSAIWTALILFAVAGAQGVRADARARRMAEL